MNYRKPLPLILSLALAAGMLFQAGTPAGAQAMDQAALAQALAAQTGQSSGGTAPTVAPAQPSVNNLTAPGTAAAATTGTAATAGAVGTAGAAGTVGADGTSSPIETMFAGQAAALGGKTQVLRQFGYSLFDKPATPSLASIGDDYVLGPGDGLVLYLWGDPVDIKEISASYSLSVDRNGFVFLPPAGQIAVWGQDLGTVRTVIKSMLDRRYKKLEMSLTLGTLRQFPVFVSGFAGRPGTVLATGADTVLTVLSRSGGIAKTGSLRAVRLARTAGAKPETIVIDFYDTLVSGTSIDLRVR
ncbi:MAG: polysaccharide biosynthesis/export family protein, partial [Rectinema sp.]